MAKKYWSYVHLLEISSSIGTQIGQTGNWWTYDFWGPLGSKQGTFANSRWSIFQAMWIKQHGGPLHHKQYVHIIAAMFIDPPKTSLENCVRVHWHQKLFPPCNAYAESIV
jgi:hypothetical protein